MVCFGLIDGKMVGTIITKVRKILTEVQKSRDDNFPKAAGKASTLLVGVSFYRRRLRKIRTDLFSWLRLSCVTSVVTPGV